MTQKENGGPAYPRKRVHGGVDLGQTEGMSLRDCFAGQALAGMFANPDISLTAARLSVSTDEFRLGTARAAYASADAMLQARK